MKPISYIAAARKLAALAARVEQAANATTPREKQVRTRAINALARHARYLFQKNAASV